MSTIEILLSFAVLIVGFIAYQAHHNQITFKAQAALDKVALEADITSVETKAKADLAALEAKFTKPAPVAVSPVTPVPPTS